MSEASFNLLQGDPATWGVPPVGKTYFGVNESGQLVTVQNDGTITPFVTGAPSVGETASASGSIAVTPGAAIHTQEITLSGVSRTVPILLGDGATVAGGQLSLVVLNTTGEDLTLTTYYDATLLDTTLMTGDVLNLCMQFYFNEGWKKKVINVPAY